MARSYTSKKPNALKAPITFTLDHVEYTCRELTALEISEVSRMSGRSKNDPASLAFVAEFYQLVLGRDQYRYFLSNVGQFGTDDETLMDIIEGIFQDMVSRPTAQPSSSSDGRETMSLTLAEDSFDRVMDRLARQGRPDLLAAVSLANPDR